MEGYEIYTFGSGYYLEKILNGLRLVLYPDNNSFVTIMKFSATGALIALALRAALTNDLKSAAKWMMGVTAVVSIFMTHKTSVHIYDKLPDEYGRLQAVRTVDQVPWGLAFIGSTTSQVGNYLAERFEMAFASVFVNTNYQKTGVLFGSKIVEDTARLRSLNPETKQMISSFYKRCMVPDLQMGYKRKNGYTIKDMVESQDLLTLLKEKSSRARLVKIDGMVETNPDGYQTCNRVAHIIADKLTQEVNQRKPKLAAGFASYFAPDKKTIDANRYFEAALGTSYGLFIRNESKTAQEILLQNVMINAISDNAKSYSTAFSSTATEATTQSAYYSIAQMAQKFIPIYRAAIECLMYGIYPLVLVLLLTPIGMETLKNYGWGFIYLQMWQPMYAILFSIAGAWGYAYSQNLEGLTFANHVKIQGVNQEISAIAGYMLASIPVLCVYVTRGISSGMGSLAQSVFYVTHNAAVQNAEQAVKGNFQVGTSSVDTHSFNNTSGNKYNDNYEWMHGMRSFARPTGSTEKFMPDGHSTLDMKGSVNDTAGLLNVDGQQVASTGVNQTLTESWQASQRQASDHIRTKTSGLSTALGYDEQYGKGTQYYQNYNNAMSLDEREAIDYSQTTLERFAKSKGISENDALSFAIAGRAGLKAEWGFLSGGLETSAEMKKELSEKVSQEDINELMSDKKLSDSLSIVENVARNRNFQESDHVNQNMINSMRNDFNQSDAAIESYSVSMEKFRSAQEAKSYSEQNAISVSQNYTDYLSRALMDKYGSDEYEHMIRNDPERLQIEINKIGQEDDVVGRILSIKNGSQLEDKRHELIENSEKAYNTHQELSLNKVKNAHQESDLILKEKTPEAFEASSQHMLAEGSRIKSEFHNKKHDIRDDINEIKTEKFYNKKSETVDEE